MESESIIHNRFDCDNSTNHRHQLFFKLQFRNSARECLGQILGSVTGIICMDKLGRKKLLSISLICIIISLILMGTYLLLKDQICNQVEEDSTIAAMCINQYLTIWPLVTISFLGFMFSAGIGPVTFVF